ncbi:MAG: 2-oxoglutarate dehydrogenase complex dihydrolipoyllysine-residue succinyltransferase [Planctomycetota bacterium]
MAVELKVPSMGESIKEVQIGEWLKKEGDWVNKDENVLIVESEKSNAEIPAPSAGILTKILSKPGEMVLVDAVVAQIDPNGKAPAGGATKTAAPAAAPSAAAPAKNDGAPIVMPSAARELSDRGLTAGQVTPTGPGGRILVGDVIQHTGAAPATTTALQPLAAAGGARQEEAVPMSMMRRTIARRLVEAQSTAALLTTFNEIDMTNVMALRGEYKDAFLAKHAVKLGFMSFFVKAAVEALKLIPAVNAEIRGNEIIYHNYYDIGVAVGGGKGLVVPIIRNAETLGFSEVEKTIENFGKRAKDNLIKPEELQGGTFTISNGGIYGSLLSTPIVNPPQSGILGLHAIQERPMAINGQVVIRPMMYVALTYDHRLVDGREGVTFLKRIKECMENPSRILLEV